MIPTIELVMLLMMLACVCLTLATFVFFLFCYLMLREVIDKTASIENYIIEQQIKSAS